MNIWTLLSLGLVSVSTTQGKSLISQLSSLISPSQRLSQLRTSTGAAGTVCAEMFNVLTEVPLLAVSWSSVPPRALSLMTNWPGLCHL